MGNICGGLKPSISVDTGRVTRIVTKKAAALPPQILKKQHHFASELEKKDKLEVCCGKMGTQWSNQIYG